MTYKSDGSKALTVVDGTEFTGVYAADGSWNIVVNDGHETVGLYHPCGAYNAVVSTSYATYAAPNGSIYATETSTGYTIPIRGRAVAAVTNKLSNSETFVSWSYNTGGPATATLWRKLNAGNKSAVPAELAKWNKDNGETLRGLTRRRLSEAQLFVGDLAAAFKTADTTPPKPAQEPVQTVPEVKATPVAPKPETPQEAPKGPSVASTVWTWLKNH